MHLIILHNRNKNQRTNGNDLPEFAVSTKVVADIVFSELSSSFFNGCDKNTVIAVPKTWNIHSKLNNSRIIQYQNSETLFSEIAPDIKRHSYLVISNGRFVTLINGKSLSCISDRIDVDVVAVNVKPELHSYNESVRLASQDKVAGFSRIYYDSVEFAQLPDDWPHHIFIKHNLVGALLKHRGLPRLFSDFVRRCSINSISLQAVSIGGVVLDLEKEQDLLELCKSRIKSPLKSSVLKNRSFSNHNNKITILKDVKIAGQVLFGKNIRIASGAVIIGPTIIGDNVKIGQTAVINSSIIGDDVCVPKKQFLTNHVISKNSCDWHKLAKHKISGTRRFSSMDLLYNTKTVHISRRWSKFSYPRFLKRIIDIVAAAAVLILFAPIIPFIALAIKINSPGPVFFKSRRQGLGGKQFNCLKFRTMAVGADKIQDKLRAVNQIDGPQFKMDDDPRVSAVGRFLRDTYIDEIPQFINVLLGQMSVVGPRPSPESENTLCPWWRDIRLMARPGITGFWQVCRTRELGKDFQEWIHYDTTYVKNLSLKMDLWICWKTVRKMVINFIEQF